MGSMGKEEKEGEQEDEGYQGPEGPGGWGPAVGNEVAHDEGEGDGEEGRFLQRIRVL